MPATIRITVLDGETWDDRTGWTDGTGWVDGAADTEPTLTEGNET